MEDNSSECCWVCLCGVEETSKQLVQCCKCPRPVHRECLARWQLQKAGQREERFCRFCFEEFPDWKGSLTPSGLKPTTPIMAVSVKGKIHKLRVKPGPEGKEDFKRQVRQLLGYTDDMEFDVIFECKTPHDGEKVQLHGFSAFDAATHCAAVSAAKRLKNKPPKASQPAAPSSSTSSTSSDRSLHSAQSGDSSTLGMLRQDSSTSAAQSSPSSRGVSFSSSSSPSLGPEGRSPSTPASTQLQAQYQHFMRRQQELQIQQQQQHPVQNPVGAAEQGEPQPAAAAAAGGVAGWRVNTSAVHSSQAAWPAAAAAPQHQVLLLHPAGRSVSSTSADASAMLTAADVALTAANAAAGSSLSSYNSGASASAAGGLLMSCPLGLEPCGSGSSSGDVAAAAATESGLWANCNSMSEPLPMLDTGRGGIAAAGGSSSAAEAAVGSIGCMGRLGGSSSSSSSTPGKGKLAAWLKHLAVKKTSRGTA